MTAASLALTALLCLLLVCLLNGQQPRGSKCWCADKGANYVKGRAKSIEVFPADHWCHRVEILVTSSSGRHCLDPASPKGRRRLTKWNKRGEEEQRRGVLWEYGPVQGRVVEEALIEDEEAEDGDEDRFEEERTRSEDEDSRVGGMGEGFERWRIDGLEDEGPTLWRVRRDDGRRPRG
ncbi:unnamed protein product [Arctogadus glacialis]